MNLEEICHDQGLDKTFRIQFYRATICLILISEGHGGDYFLLPHHVPLPYYFPAALLNAIINGEGEIYDYFIIMK